MRRNMSGNLGLYEYLWPGSVYSKHPVYRTLRGNQNLFKKANIRVYERNL